MIVLDDLAVIITSDDAHFHLDRHVRNQNCSFWAKENPKELHQKPLHSEKVTVWCTMSKFGVIGPYFFEDDRGMAVTVNAERYVAMLQEFFLPCMQENEPDIQGVWFQQNGATAHTAQCFNDCHQ